jgi:hypothetical protein
MTQSRAVDLHKDQPEPMSDVFHQRGLAVTRRRNQHQQAGQIRAAVLAGGAHLLGQVVADHAEVDIVDQLVAHEGAKRLGLEFIEPQRLAFARHHFLTQCLVALQTG